MIENDKDILLKNSNNDITNHSHLLHSRLLTNRTQLQHVLLKKDQFESIQSF